MATAAASNGGVPVIRPPLPLRLYVAAFTLFWCGLLLSFGVRAVVDGKPAVLPVLALMLAFGGTIGIRLFRMSVMLLPDELVIRNHIRTRRVQRRGPAP
jgi:hypothetical protein